VSVEVETFINSLVGLPRLLADLRDQVAKLRAEVAALREATPPMLVSVDEAARRLGISTWSVRRLIKAGSLVGSKVGGSWRVDLRAITTALDDDEVARLALEART
jgi:excisionase family DNA binding protein